MTEDNAGGPALDPDRHASAIALERCLTVGMEVFLDASPGNPNAPRFPARLRGWERGHYILVALVPGGTVPVVRQGKECVIRFMHEGEVWGFSAAFSDQGFESGYPIYQLYWPREVARVQVRKHERVAIKTPCTIEFEDGTQRQATVGDLSGGGCSLVVATEIAVGSPLRLSFKMPDGGNVSRRPVIVRNRRVVGGEGIQYGCQFQAADEKDHGIQLFVARKIAAVRGESAPHLQILVLSRNERDLEMVQQCLAGQPYEVIEASGILDLGYRLHSCEAVAILISAEQKELSATEVLSLIRQSPGMEQIPLFLYGGGEGLRDQARHSGATLCLNDLSDTNLILSYLPRPVAPTAPEAEVPAPTSVPNSSPATSSGPPPQDDEDEILLEDPA